MSNTFRKNPGARVPLLERAAPSIAIVKRAAGSFGPARLRPPISTRAAAGSAADHRGDRPEVRAAPHQPRHAGRFGRQRPAFFGEPAGQPACDTSRTADGRMPPNAGRATSGQRNSVESLAARRIDQRQIAAHRIGQEPHRLGRARLPVLRELEPLEPRRRRQLRRQCRRLRLRAAARMSGASPARRAVASCLRPASPRPRGPPGWLRRRRRRAPDSRSRRRQSKRAPRPPAPPASTRATRPAPRGTPRPAPAAARIG